MPSLNKNSDFRKRNMMPNSNKAKIRKIASALREAEKDSAPPNVMLPERRRALERTAEEAVNASLIEAAFGFTRRYRRSKPL